MQISELKNFKIINFIPIILIAILPIVFFLGSGALNLTVILIDIFFISEIIINKKFNFLKNRIFYLLLFFWFILLISLFFSINFAHSLPRSIGFVRFIFFSFAINYYLIENNQNYSNLIFKFWTIIFLIISVDLIYEYYFGYNLLGFKSYIPGRLSGFLDQELKIGHLYSGLILISLSFIYLYSKKFQKENNNFFIKTINKNIFYIFLIIFLFISLIIGERSNMLKTLIISSMFLFFFEKKKYYIKIVSIFVGILIFITVTFNNEGYKYRVWRMFLSPLLSNPAELIMKSHYGSHYRVAIDVFNNYKFTGVGLKNYRIAVKISQLELMKKGYSENASIHPHQVHFEILSETGLIGYISFLMLFIYSLYFSINNYFSTRNIYQLSGILFVFISLMPIIPSGSFFTSFGATLFWLNYGLIIPKKLLN